MMKAIVTGNTKVIESGSVILFDGESSLQLTIEIGTGFTIVIEIAFADKTELEQVIKKEVDESNNYIKYTCYNFDNVLGTGTVEPLDLATYNNKNVSMHFWSYLLGNKENKHSRRIDYSVYLEQ